MRFRIQKEGKIIYLEASNCSVGREICTGHTIVPSYETVFSVIKEGVVRWIIPTHLRQNIKLDESGNILLEK